MSDNLALQERLAFIALDQEAQTALAKAKPIIEQALPESLDAFYDQVRRFPDVAKLFGSESHISGAKGAQARHWSIIATGAFDRGYVEGVQRIGTTHARIGLEPRWYIGGYALVMDGLMKAIVRDHESRRKRFGRHDTGEALGSTLSAVMKAAMLDMDFVISLYLQAAETARAEAEAKLAVDPDIVAVLLRAADALTDHVTAAKGGPPVDTVNAALIVSDLQQFTGVEALMNPADDGDDISFVPQMLALDLDETPQAILTPDNDWTIRFKPAAALYRNANDAILLIRELDRLGTTRVVVDQEVVPSLPDKVVTEPVLTWSVQLCADAAIGESQIRDVFEFVQGDCELHVFAGSVGAEEVASFDDPVLASPNAVEAESPEQLLDRLMREANVAAETETAAPTHRPVQPLAQSDVTSVTGNRPEALVQTTIRVDLERVDRLIDLVGELVINQAMLAQRVVEAGLARSSTIALGLDDLEQLTREIQDSVMAIRAQPVKSVFQRMPRLVREVAAATGKKVRLVTEGEGTEVDKTVIERLSDPISSEQPS